MRRTRAGLQEQAQKQGSSTSCPVSRHSLLTSTITLSYQDKSPSRSCPHTLHWSLDQALCRSKYSSFVTMAIRNEKAPNGSISTSSSSRRRQVKRRGFFSRLISIALRYALALAACLTRRLLTLPQIVHMVLAPDSHLPLPVIAQTTYQ